MKAKIYNYECDITPQLEGLATLRTLLGRLPDEGFLYDVEFDNMPGVCFPRVVYLENLELVE